MGTTALSSLAYLVCSPCSGLQQVADGLQVVVLARLHQRGALVLVTDVQVRAGLEGEGTWTKHNGFFPGLFTTNG